MERRSATPARLLCTPPFPHVSMPPLETPHRMVGLLLFRRRVPVSTPDVESRFAAIPTVSFPPPSIFSYQAPPQCSLPSYSRVNLWDDLFLHSACFFLADSSADHNHERIQCVPGSARLPPFPFWYRPTSHCRGTPPFDDPRSSLGRTAITVYFSV